MNYHNLGTRVVTIMDWVGDCKLGTRQLRTQTHHISIEVDLQKLVDNLGHKAVANKKHSSRLASGAIRLTDLGGTGELSERKGPKRAGVPV